MENTLSKIQFSLIIILLMLANELFAQQEKGDTQMSLSASFRSNKTAGTTSNSFNFQYSASKFYSKNLELGLSYFGSISTGFSYNGLSPFASYNMLSKNGRFDSE